MKFAEVNKRYTEIVTEYLLKGYTINAGTLGGSQGEIAHIDLTNGIEIIRVIIEQESKRREHEFYDVCQIIVGKCTDDRVKINSSDRSDTIWNNRLEIIFCEEFYKLGEDRNTGTEYGTKEEAQVAKYKRWQRCGNSSERRSELTDKYRNLGIRYIKRTCNRKRVNPTDVRVFEDECGYIVRYKNDWYRLA